LIIGISTRLTTKPQLSLETRAVLPIEAVSDTIASLTASVVCNARITSTSAITGTGLKKCMPTTRDGSLEAAAMRVTEIDDVLVAKIASGRQIASSSRMMPAFSS
jgi:hypothetical protein